MDITGKIFDGISPAILERWKYHKAMDEYLVTLNRELERLNGRKRDIESQLSNDLQGENKLKDEVDIWLKRVETINGEIENIQAEKTTVKYFSRFSLGKKASDMIKEVRDLLISSIFSDGLVIPVPPRGDMLPTTTILGGETTFKRNMEEIRACLMNDEARKIGVYGMGGIGKTTALEGINNSLLKEDKFDKVIWITVSRESDVRRLQNKIARKLDDDFCKDLENNDEQTRRAKLFGKLMKMRFLLILDDLWEIYPLESVGIPQPTAQNGCKMVLTTRSHDICLQMSCEPIIKMELLSETEASELFFDIVGHNLLTVPGLPEIMEKVVQECARLPLAIVTVANSLKNTNDCNKWELALADLEDHISDPESAEKILKILKFSYDRLNDKNEQYCLLYCALYSEDYPIERTLLIDQLIAKGMVERSKKRKRKDKRIRQRRMKKCQIMLDNLVKVCLLNNTTNDEGAACLKMHDLIRDMAIQITSSDNSSPRFLVKAGEEWDIIPREEEWKEDLSEVSLMANNIFEIPLDLEPPNCPRVSTMFLNDNRHLRSIPGIFFLYMKGLTVLDLSCTSINKLPESVSDLVNLGVLLLKGCKTLQHVPSLAKLINLRRLDLGGTGINEVPHGLEMLIKLRYLDLSVNRLSWISDGVLRKFVHLRCLSLLCDLETPRVSEEDLRQLRKLECLYCVFYDLDSYNAYVRSLEVGAPNYYLLQLGLNPGERWAPTREKVVNLGECKISKSVATGGDCPLLLPANIEALRIQRCHFNVSSLCELSSFENVTNLKYYVIRDCAEIEYLYSYSPNIFSLFQRVVVLNLEAVCNLRGFIRREEGSPSVLPLPPGTFSSLNVLILCRCNKIKKLFLTGPLPNLGQLVVSECEQLVEIISTTYDEDEENQNERRESTTDCPKLWILKLSVLPELQSIPVKSDSVQHVTILKCPKLKKIPPIDRETCPPSLQSVCINKDLWDSLEWDYPNAKDFIESMMTLSHDD